MNTDVMRLMTGAFSKLIIEQIINYFMTVSSLSDILELYYSVLTATFVVKSK